jgi:hypothetical protein
MYCKAILTVADALCSGAMERKNHLKNRVNARKRAGVGGSFLLL